MKQFIIFVASVALAAILVLSCTEEYHSGECTGTITQLTPTQHVWRCELSETFGPNARHITLRLSKSRLSNDVSNYESIITSLMSAYENGGRVKVKYNENSHNPNVRYITDVEVISTRSNEMSPGKEYPLGSKENPIYVKVLK